MAFLSISISALLLVHLTLTSASNCPQKDAFDWETVSFQSRVSIICRGYSDRLLYLAPSRRSPQRNASNGPLAMMQCFVPDSTYVVAQLPYLGSHPTFQVPLDYAYPQGEKLAIALLKIPANISTSDPAYRGPILINPGGPGGSGVDFALEIGSVAQTIAGADFDIIGFDPRGKYIKSLVTG